jgi:hypothetical protein
MYINVFICMYLYINIHIYMNIYIEMFLLCFIITCLIYFVILILFRTYFYLTGPRGLIIYLIKHHHHEGVTKLVVSHNVRGHDKDINTLAVSPNDSMAASGSQVSKHMYLCMYSTHICTYSCSYMHVYLFQYLGSES